ncbi:hypothetical protein Nepgr_014748 [Nepenthes gracilis]|uniref:Uncharacterized protein n=1 Tax=Nepenthes gracilis TaxID=150966 RepID=A0AAD3SKL5_NEPGR|nr:hypothetical protein Nepgr_014748 [Nepenthes gracilis]
MPAGLSNSRGQTGLTKGPEKKSSERTSAQLAAYYISTESRRDFVPALSCADPDDGVVGSDSVTRAFAAAFHMEHSACWNEDELFASSWCRSKGVVLAASGIENWWSSLCGGARFPFMSSPSFCLPSPSPSGYCRCNLTLVEWSGVVAVSRVWLVVLECSSYKEGWLMGLHAYDGGNWSCFLVGPVLLPGDLLRLLELLKAMDYDISLAGSFMLNFAMSVRGCYKSCGSNSAPSSGLGLAVSVGCPPVGFPCCPEVAVFAGFEVVPAVFLVLALLIQWYMLVVFVAGWYLLTW